MMSFTELERGKPWATGEEMPTREKIRVRRGRAAALHQRRARRHLEHRDA